MAKSLRATIVRVHHETFEPGLPRGRSSPAPFRPRTWQHQPAAGFSDVPTGTRSLALIMNDPDAPHGTFTHWIVFNLPPNTRELAEDNLPPGTVLGKNDFGDVGYGGPRPPSGTHRYFFHAYALDSRLDLPSGVSATDIEKALDGRVLENAQLMGRYSEMVPSA